MLQLDENFLEGGWIPSEFHLRHSLLEGNLFFCPTMVRRITATICFGLLAASLSFAAHSDNAEATKEPSDSKVHVIEFDGFWRFLDRNPLVLMEFYAPWW